jgi:hypothetical protein
MNWRHWTVLGTFFLGFLWSPAWLIALVMYLYWVDKGMTVAAIWATGHLHGRDRDQG